MSDKALDNNDTLNENADNLSENAEQDEAIARELNTDDSIAGGGMELEVEKQEEIDKLREELEEAKDKYVRLVAEFENFRKRNAKERIELIQTAGRDIVQSLLVVLDDSDRAAKQLEATTDVTAIKEGVTLVFGKLKNTLQQKGLRVMDSMNQPFDPELHEAITEIPAPTEELKGKILDVIEPGYYLNDKLIRHAKVVVGK